MNVTFHVIDPKAADAIASMTAYFDELNATFPGGFDPGDTLTADADALRPPTGAFLVARNDDGAVLACGGVQQHTDTSGEIKRMWVADAARGLGLGKRMLQRLEDEVTALGYDEVVLDTNDNLGPAIAMYEGAGYRQVEAYNDNPYARLWFRKRLRRPPQPNPHE